MPNHKQQSIKTHFNHC